MKQLVIKIAELNQKATCQVREFGSMEHIIPTDGAFHDLSYTGLDFNDLDLNRKRRFGLDVIYLDQDKSVAVVLNKLNQAAVVDYKDYSNLILRVNDDGSVIINRFIKYYAKTESVKLIIEGLITSFNTYDKLSLYAELTKLGLSEYNQYINYCYENYNKTKAKG